MRPAEALENQSNREGRDHIFFKLGEEDLQWILVLFILREALWGSQTTLTSTTSYSGNPTLRTF